MRLEVFTKNAFRWIGMKWGCFAVKQPVCQILVKIDYRAFHPDQASTETEARMHTALHSLADPLDPAI